MLRLLSVIAVVLLLSHPSWAETPPDTDGASPDAPLSTWTVGPINMSGGKDAYCSMKNKYAGGYMLVFARNAQGGNSFAFDFGEEKLTPGGQYPVRMDLGPLSRNMTGIAATRQVLILQMGEDKPFYDMMRQNNTLRAIINGRERRYGLDSAGDALNALDKCAEALMSKSKFATVEIPVKPFNRTVAVGEKAIQPQESLVAKAVETSLQDEIEILRAQNRKLMLENQRIISQAEHSDPMDLPKKSAPLSNEGPAVVALPVERVAVRSQPARLQSLSEDLPSDLGAALKASGVILKKEKARYYWTTGKLSAEVVVLPMAEKDKPEDIMKRYLASFEYDCNGDFAQQSAKTFKRSTYDLLSGEAACIGDLHDKAKALTLFKKKNRAIVIDMNSAPADMADLLDIRDKVIAHIGK